MKDGPLRPYTQKNQIHLMLRWETSLHKREGERVVYGILDFFGDVGGFLEATTLNATILLFILQFQPLNLFLVSKIYKYRPKNADTSNFNQSNPHQNDMNRD